MDVNQLEKLVLYTGNSILALNLILVVTGIIYSDKIRPTAIDWVFKWAVYTFVLGTIELVLIKVIFSKKFIYIQEVLNILNYLGIKDYNFISPFSYLLKFIFLGLFFRDIFKLNQHKRAFQIIIYLLVAFEFIMVIVFKSYQSYDSLSSTIKNIFLMTGSGLFLYLFYNNDKSNLALQKNPYFWLGIGLFVPSITDFLLELIFSKLYDTDLSSFYQNYIYRNISQMVGFIFLIRSFSLSKYLKFLPKGY